MTVTVFDSVDAVAEALDAFVSDKVGGEVNEEDLEKEFTEILRVDVKDSESVVPELDGEIRDSETVGKRAAVAVS